MGRKSGKETGNIWLGIATYCKFSYRYYLAKEQPNLNISELIYIVLITHGVTIKGNFIFSDYNQTQFVVIRQGKETEGKRGHRTKGRKYFEVGKYFVKSLQMHKHFRRGSYKEIVTTPRL